jgi:membrane-bound lytic murein transglycosylase B
MFWKKRPQSKKPDQSQSLSNVTQTGGMIQMGQAGRDLEQSQAGDLQTQQQGITAAEVVTLLEQFETAVKAASIDAAQQEELLDYLRPAKREAGQESPDKDLVGQNLKRVSETMQTLKETTEAGKSLWQTGAEILKAVAPWIGVAAAFLVP